MDIRSVPMLLTHVVFTLNNRIYSHKHGDVSYDNKDSKEDNGQEVLHRVPLFFAKLNVGVG